MVSGITLASAYIQLLPSMDGFQRAASRQVGPIGSQVGRQFGGEFSGGMERETSGRMRGAGQRVGAGFGKAFAAAGGALAAAGIGQAIGSAVTGAGELQQSIGAIDTVFKGSADQIHKWAKGAAGDVGLSQNEFNELGTLIGTQLKNGGTAMEDLAPKTKGLITLGADLSSMFGGTTADAVGALSSALKGERDPIEAFGVSLSQAKIDAEAAALGFKKVDGAFSSSANQAATLSLIQKQSADAVGNFAKETDTYAGQQQVLKANFKNLRDEVGTKLLPVFTGLFEKINKNLPAIKTFAAEVRDRLSAGFERVRDVVDKLRPAFDKVVGLIRDNPDFVKAFGIALGVLIGGITAVTVATTLFSIALNSTGIPLIIIGIAALAAGLVIAYKRSETFRAVVDAIGQKVKQFAGFITGTVVPAVARLASDIGAKLSPIVQQLGKMFQDRIVPAVAKAVQKFREAQPAINQVIAFVGKLIVFGGRLVGMMLRMWATIASKVIPVLIRIAGFIFSKVIPAFASVVTAGVKVIAKVIGIGRAFFDSQKKVARFVIETVAGIGRFIDKVVNGIGGLPGKVLGFVNDMKQAGGRFIGGLFDGILGAARSAGGFVTDLVGSIKDAINNALNLPLTINFKKGPININAELIPRFASGTNFAPGGIALVGEEGPELVNLPRGSKVSTAAQTARMAPALAGVAAGASGGGTMVLRVGGHDFVAYLEHLADGRVESAASMRAERSRAAW